MTDAETENLPTVYDLVGGAPFFDELVDRFYRGVADDPVIGPMYPADLTASKAHLAGFLCQYWGGPPHYSAERGHPRLRMRHVPFVIDQAAHDAWLSNMVRALDEMAPHPEIHKAMVDYFTMAALHLINATDSR